MWVILTHNILSAAAPLFTLTLVDRTTLITILLTLLSQLALPENFAV
jgi:hypothetical protein